jgi:hypothetical protein
VGQVHCGTRDLLTDVWPVHSTRTTTSTTDFVPRPSKIIPVTATPTTVTVLWADLTGGKPSPSVTPKELTGMSFYFTWNGTGSVAYPVDITIDDLSFVP